MSDVPTVTVREWTDVVRRARLGKTSKYVALILATYADFADGTRVYPGIAGIAHAAEVDYKTAQRAVSELLRVGLIAVVEDRSGVRGKGTEYRLVLSDGLLDRVAVQSPAEFRMGVERIGAARRRSRRTPHRAGGPDPEGQPTGRVVPEEEGRPTGRAVLAEGRPTPRPGDAPSGSTTTPIEQPTTTTPHKTADLETAVTGPGARSRDDPGSSKCGNPRCAKGYVLTADGTAIERCPDDSHPPPDNVIPFPRTA